MSLRILFLYLLISFITDTLLFSMSAAGINNKHILNIYSVTELILICWLYYLETNRRVLKRILLIVAFLYSIFSFSLIGIDDFVNEDLFINSLEAAISIVISVVYFFELLSMKIQHLTDHYFFWINTAILLYFSGSLFVFLFIGVILDQTANTTIKNLWIIHNVFHILYNLILFYSGLVWKRQYTLRLQ